MDPSQRGARRPRAQRAPESDAEDVPTGENLAVELSSSEILTEGSLVEEGSGDGVLDDLDTAVEDQLYDDQEALITAPLSDPRRTLTYGASAAPAAAPVSFEQESFVDLPEPLPEEFDDDLEPMDSMPTRVEREEDIRASFAEDVEGSLPRLILIGGNDRGKEFSLKLGDNSIGRGIDNDVILADIAVSRKHTLICYENNRFVVRDLGSGNGTMVNGEKIGIHVLEDGDQLELGNTLLRFSHPSFPVPFNELRTMINVPEKMPGAPAAIPAYRPSQTKLIPPEWWRALFDGKMKRLLFYGLIAVTVCSGFIVGIRYLLLLKQERHRPVAKVPPPTDRALVHEFNEGIKQYNARNWEQAREHLLKVLALAPQQVNIRQYVDTATAEIKARDALARARALLQEGNFAKARFEAAKIGRGSTYVTEADVLAQRINDEELSKLLEQAKNLQASGNTGAALAKVKRAKQIAPTNTTVKDLYDRLTASTETPRPHETPPRERRAPPSKIERSKPVERPPAVSGGKLKEALALYRKRQWGPAQQQVKDLAASSTGRQEQSLRALAEAIRLVGQNLIRAGQTTDPALALKYLEVALKNDLRVEKGIHQLAIKEQMIKLARTQAPRALQQRKYTEAYAAIRIIQKHDKVDASLQRVVSALEKRAQELLARAQSLRGRNMPEARRLWQEVLALVPPTNPTYQKAYSALNSSGTSFSDEDEE